LLLGLDPTFHNTNNGVATDTDTRSDNKGPEPEALTIGQFGSDMLAFVGLERQNGILVYNITDPNNPSHIGYIPASSVNAANGLVSPESMVFISAANSPSGSAMLVTGFEVTNGIGVYSVPEPSRAMLGLVGVAFIALRRRRVG
jgi:MYXO-CTERM domain-containing protein